MWIAALQYHIYDLSALAVWHVLTWRNVCVQLDQEADGSAIQDILLKMTGGRSVPRVFINGKFLGGGDETAAAAANGQLETLLKEAGVI